MFDPQAATPSFDPVESLEAFAHIGHGGTPPGMINSSWSAVATGQIGGAEVTEDSDPSVEPPRGRAWKGVVGGLLASVALLLLGWQLMRARAAEQAAVEEPEPVIVIVAPPPTPMLEDVPRVEPEPEPTSDEDEAADERDNNKGKRSGKKAQSGGKTGESAQACKEYREKTAELFDWGHWDEVLSRTRSSKCWPSAAERKRLRMHAMFQLGRLDECIATGRGVSDAAVAKLVQTCKNKQEAKRK